MRNAFLLLIVLLVGCSPARRIQRICQKHPDVCKTDTLHITDTVLVPSVRIDTAFLYTEGKLYTVEKERATVRVKVKRDTVYVDAECKADTIYREHNIIRTKVVVEEKKSKGWAIWVALLWYFIGLLFAFFWTRKV